MSGRSVNRREERPADVARRLKDSLISTEDGLKTFLQSLERSGLRTAAPAYRQMALAVAQQKMWADANGRRELDRLFKGVARNAAEIEKLMTRFAEAIAPLAALNDLKAEIDEAAPAGASAPAGAPAPTDSPAPANDPTPAPSPLARRTLARLMQEGRMSEGRLAQALEIELATLAPLLDELAEAGLIVRRGWGRSKSAAVAPGWARTLLALDDDAPS